VSINPRDTSGQLGVQVYTLSESAAANGTIAAVKAGTVAYVATSQQSVTPACPVGLYVNNFDGSNSHEADVYFMAISQ